MNANTITLLATVVTAIATVIYTGGTFMLWWTTRKSVKLLEQQVKKQTDVLFSQAQSETFGAHRDLFLAILQDEHLLRLFSSEENASDDQVRRDFLATLLINNARRVFMDHSYEVASPTEKESFMLDAQDLFSMPFVKERWKNVAKYHPKRFQNFITEHCLLETSQTFK